jgi:hypothetical protein
VLKAEQLLQVEISKSTSFSIEKLLAVSLFLVALGSGVCFKQGLIALASQLTRDKKPLQCLDEHHVIILNYEHPSHGVASFSDDIAKCQRDLYLSPDALVAVIAYLSKRKQHNLPEIIDEEYVWQIIKTHCLQNIQMSVNSLSQFLIGCGFAMEKLSALPLPTFLRNYALGKLSSTPAPLENILYRANGEKSKKKVADFPLTLGRSQPIQMPVKSKSKFDYRSFEQELTEILSDPKQRITSNANIHKALCKLHSDWGALPYSASLLLEYLKEGFDIKLRGVKIKNFGSVSSGRRAKGALAKCWINRAPDDELFMLDEEDMDELCMAMLTLKSPKNICAKQSFLNELEPFIRFLNVRYNIAYPSSFFDQRDRLKTVVRSYHYDEYTYRIFRRDVQASLVKQEMASRIIDAIDVAIILSRRIFSRPSESWKLQINDVEDSPELFIFIRKNQFGRNKRFYSRRKIPFALYAMDDEISILRRFISSRQAELKAAGRKNGLLFSLSADCDAKFSVKDMSTFFGSFLSDYLGHQSVFYQWRHTGISELSVVLFGTQEMIEKFTPYTYEHAQKIKNYLNNGRERHLLYELASEAGHADPTTSVFSYMHNLDMILNAYLNEGRGIKASQVYRLCGVGDRNDESVLSSKELRCRLNSKLNRYTDTKLNSITKSLPDAPLASYNLSPFEKCIQALKLIDRKQSDIAYICRELEIEISTLESWQSNAKLVKQHFVTSKGRERLFPLGSKSLCPIKPDLTEEALVYSTVNKMRKIFASEPENIIWLINTVLDKTAHGEPQIELTNPGDAAKIIKFIGDVIPANRWELNIDPLLSEESRCLDAWKSKLPDVKVSISQKTVKRVVQFPNGRGQLFFIKKVHANELERKGYQRVGSNILKYVMHGLAILLWEKIHSTQVGKK